VSQAKPQCGKVPATAHRTTIIADFFSLTKQPETTVQS
jgi:hypothetical protein